MRCPRCGAESIQGAIFCAVCGSKMIIKPSESAIAPRIRAPEKRKPVLWLLISVIGVALISSGIIVWSYEVDRAHDSIAGLNSSPDPFEEFGNLTSALLWTLAALVLIVVGVIFTIAGIVLAIAASFD